LLTPIGLPFECGLIFGPIIPSPAQGSKGWFHWAFEVELGPKINPENATPGTSPYRVFRGQ
jgi:hypothetical protein